MTMTDTDETTPFDPTESLRGADLQTLAKMLETRHAHKVDAIVPAGSLAVADGHLTVPGIDHELTEDGVTTVDGHLTISNLAVGGLADRYEVPVKYLRRCQAQKPDLFAHNVNAWMADDSENILLRTFTTDDGGYLRQVLSDKYDLGLDYLDALYAALDGASSVSTDLSIESVDLTERAMRVRFVAPQITTLAPDFLRGYRSPFGEDGGNDEITRWRPIAAREGKGYEPGTEPIVAAGLELSTSETGHGAFQLAPRFVFQICRNGLIIKADAFRKIHLGARLDQGIIRHSADTMRLNVDLIRSQTVDAIATFLDVDYMRQALDGLSEKAAKGVAKPDLVIQTVAKRLRYTDEERETILAHFIAGGQVTCGGIMQAVTSTAQVIADADRAAEIEGSAIDALDAAFAVA